MGTAMLAVVLGCEKTREAGSKKLSRQSTAGLTLSCMRIRAWLAGRGRNEGSKC